MMQQIIFGALSNDLAKAIANDDWRDRVVPAPVNTWIAMSGLQKGIRRGNMDLALSCGLTLLQERPQALWRRLGVIAFEDIGLGDFDLVGQTVSILGRKVVRKSLGGEWTVASHLIRRMCQSVKCRAADDLVVVIEHDPLLDELKRDSEKMSRQDLEQAFLNNADLAEQGLLAWLLAGTDRLPSDNLPRRSGDIAVWFEFLLFNGYPDTLIEVCRRGMTTTNVVLPVLFPLLWKRFDKADSQVLPDHLPEVADIGSVPGYVFDCHTRDGKRVFKNFPLHNAQIAQFMASTGLRGVDWQNTLSLVVFRAESGLVDQRLRWGSGDALMNRADILEGGLPEHMASDGLALVKSQIPQLNAVRRKVLLGVTK